MRLLLVTSSCPVWFGSALTGNQPSVAEMLNKRIAGSNSGDIYKGGENKGVLVRTPDFFDGGDQIVVPATLWHNDIYAPSQMYTTVASPWCPNNGNDGYYSTDSCDSDPWAFATVAVVMADAMGSTFDDFSNIQNDDWGNGVFYASDSNAADKRCVYQQDNGGWDCPGGWVDYDSGQFSQTSNNHGAGSYGPGNPWVKGLASGGGGAGCHFDTNQNAIDQPDANGEQGNLVQDASCQCNYGYKYDWGKWVEAWSFSSQQKPGFESRNWLDGSGRLAPAWAVDTGACWVNNPRDMINIQNALHWSRSSWNNQLIPASTWSSGSSEELRKYWGWNEIPVAKSVVDDALSWDAIIIKLPADACQNGDWGAGDGPNCLSHRVQQQLQADLAQFVQQKKLKTGFDNVGNRPGSYILFVKEYGTTYGTQGGADFGVNWSREFFCSDWMSPNGKYQVVFAQGNDGSACYFDLVSSPPPPPTPPPPPPSPSPSPSSCHVGDHVQCSGQGSEMCHGDQCCHDGHTCPSAHIQFEIRKKCKYGKHYNCLTSSTVVV